mgnify:CR=1 FL=1
MSKYQVTVQPDGRTFDVSDDETILDGALRQNVILPYGCRSGNCGTCQVKLLSGGYHYPHDRFEQYGACFFACFPECHPCSSFKRQCV